MSQTPALTEAPVPTRRQRMLAVGVGNFLEWFEFVIYGNFAVYIGHAFFPSGDAMASVLSSLGVFAIGFLARPVGGLIFGPLGNVIGRKRVLILTTTLMGTGTVLIGLMPTYATIGVAAPVLVVTVRIVQGLGAGGEWSSAATYMVETAAPGRRARSAQVVSFSAGLAFLAGAVSVAGLNALLDDDAMQSWGWRLPFLLGAVLMVVARYYRRRLDDTPTFDLLRERAGTVGHAEVAGGAGPAGPAVPAGVSVERARILRGDVVRPFLMTLVISVVFGVGLYYLVTYSTVHLVSVLGFDRQPVFLCNVVVLAIYCCMHYPVATVSDRIGRRPVMIFGAVGITVIAFPLFLVLDTGNWFLIGLLLVALGLFVACTVVSNVVLLAEVFPAWSRSAGSALGYNLAQAAFAGPAPLIAAALVEMTGSNTAPAYYLAGVSAVCAVIIIRWLPETRGTDLNRYQGDQAVGADGATGSRRQVTQEVR